MKTVHMLRHGTVHNPEKILYGQLPGYYLSSAGEVEARMAGSRLADRPITYVATSPLERCVQTAEQAGLESHGKLHLLSEAGQDFEGKRFPSTELLRKPSTWLKLWNPYGPSWGEPYWHIASRMSVAVHNALGCLEDGHEAVLVSHQVPIVQLRRSFEGRPAAHDPSRRQCAPASITSFTFDTHLDSIDYWEPTP